MIRYQRLLIVDDDADDRYFFKLGTKTILPHLTIQEAWNGLDALTQLRSAEVLPQLIFLDINMPVMDGFECLAALKKDPQLKHIPVVILTTADGHREKCMAAGAFDYQIKPLDIPQWGEMVLKILETYLAKGLGN